MSLSLCVCRDMGASLYVFGVEGGGGGGGGGRGGGSGGGGGGGGGLVQYTKSLCGRVMLTQLLRLFLSGPGNHVCPGRWPENWNSNLPTTITQLYIRRIQSCLCLEQLSSQT